MKQSALSKEICMESVKQLREMLDKGEIERADYVLIRNLLIDELIVLTQDDKAGTV